jgi:ribosomal protein S4
MVSRSSAFARDLLSCLGPEVACPAELDRLADASGACPSLWGDSLSLSMLAVLERRLDMTVRRRGSLTREG